MIIEEGDHHKNFFWKRLGKCTQCTPTARMTEKPILEKEELEPRRKAKMIEIIRGRNTFLI